jgi:hypothetical protein
MLCKRVLNCQVVTGSCAIYQCGEPGRQRVVGESALIPLACDLFDDSIGAIGVEPKQLDRVDSSHLHLQCAAGLGEFEMLFRGLGGSDNA